MSSPQILFPTKSELQNIIPFYLFSLLSGLFIWPIWGWIIALQVGLTVFAGLVLMQLSIIYINRRQWFLLVVKLFTPGILWLLFGVGTLVCFVGVENIPLFGYYEDITLLLNSIYVFIGACCYMLGFHAMYNLTKGRSIYKTQPSEWRVTLLLFILLVFDWYARLDLIHSGTYFTWVMRVGIDSSARGTSLIFHIQRTIWTVIWPLLIYKIINSNNKWLYILVFVFQFGIVVGSGDRSNIFISLVVILISIAVIKQISINLRIILLGGLAIFILFAILGPMIQEARFLMRAEGSTLLQDPSQIPKLFFTQYLPEVANRERLFGESSDGRQGLFARIGSYASYFGSLQQAYRDGRSLLSFQQTKNALLMLVPSILNPTKNIIDADYIAQSHFNIGEPGHDTPGTYVTDAFAHLHIAGIILLFLIAGGTFGLISTHLINNYDTIGELLIIGLLPAFVPTGDSFSSLLSNIRNIFLLLILFKLVLHFGRRKIV